MLPAPKAQGRWPESRGPGRGLGWRWGGHRGSQAEQGQARVHEGREGLRVKVTVVAGPAAARVLLTGFLGSAESHRLSLRCLGSLAGALGLGGCGVRTQLLCGVWGLNRLD